MRLEGLVPSNARSTNGRGRVQSVSAMAIQSLDDGTRLKVLTAIAAAGLALAATLAASHAVSFSQGQMPLTFAPPTGIQTAMGYTDVPGSVVSVRLDQESGTLTASTIEAPAVSFAPLEASVVEAARLDRANFKDASTQHAQAHAVGEAQ